MRPLQQTRFGGPDAPLAEQGNCLQACLASLFDLTLDEAFDCFQHTEGAWFLHFERWLADRNLACAIVPYDEKLTGWIQGYHLIVTMSPRLEGEHHMVVGHNGSVCFDPHPDAERDGPGQVKAFWLLTVRDPALQQKR